MKKIIYPFSALLIFATAIGCRKNMEHISKSIVIDTALASGSEYVLDLKSFGDADDIAVITKQASSYTRSEIVNTATTFAPVYYYSATTKTSVTDQVVLSITEGNGRGGGNRHNCDSTTITINFVTK
ncbi:MAG: hypothetical protein M3040_07890 [Bacteroidota bacterium]|nr:hypothetical protein [Bacteroidota bacterium]